MTPAPQAPEEDFLAKIERYLDHRPFVPFKVRCGKTEFEIKSPDQCRFTRYGNVEISRVEVIKSILNNDHINLVEPL